MEPVARQGYGKRIEQALLAFISQIGERRSLDWLGEAVAKQEGRSKRYGRSTISAWIAEENEPTIKTFEALAVVLHTAPEWLAFGRAVTGVAIVTRDPRAPRAKGNESA